MLTVDFRRLVAVLAVTTLVAGCDMSMGNLTGRATDEWTHHYPLTAGGEVRVVNTNGRIEVEPGEDGRVARELLPRIGIKEDVAPDRVFIETQRMSGIMLGAAFEVRYHVRAPRSAVVNMTNTNGQITLNGLGGNVVARTTNGAVVGKALTGAVEARTTNGSVKLDLAAVGSERISARTTNGAVVVSLPQDAKADVSASWTNGGINVAPDLKLEVTDRSRRRFEGRMNGGGTRIELETTNGGIRLRSRMEAEAEDTKGTQVHE